jgi:TolB-like protein
MTPAASVFQFGAFSLDAGERMLLRDGRLVPLPAKVLSTLIILVRNHGHVVEKEFLMKEVWPDEVVEEGNLAQHIFMLRKALGEGTEHNYIETVPRRGYRFFAELIESEEKADEGIESVAVLPFANASPDPDMDYLSDGITESIMNSLSRLPQLKVIARNTVFSFKGLRIDAREVGRNLGVRVVVMGVVQRFGEQLVVSAELIDVEDGSRIWGERYERRVSAIFSLQDELAWEIATNNSMGCKAHRVNDSRSVAPETGHPS